MKPCKKNSMLIDIKYLRQNKRTGEPDCLYVIWKDLDTGAKYLQTVTEPKMDIYFEKPEFRNHNHNLNYQRLEKLDKKTVKYKDILFEIANEIGESGKAFVSNAIQTRNFNALRELQLYPYVFGSDIDIRGWYRVQWLQKLNNKRVKKLDKGFMDIEADSYGIPGFPSATQCPVNAVTVINARDNECYTFLLREGICKSGEAYEKQQEQIDYFEEHLDEFIEELHEDFDEEFGRLKYKIYMYDDERKMLCHLFQMINIIKLDIIGIWNISFDIPYLIERMRVLGLDPTEVMSHPDFKYKQCYFKEDTRNFNVKDKNDFFTLTSYTQFICQMELYAAERKGRQELRSSKLDAVASKELRSNKVKMGADENIKTLPYRNWWKFVKYNIKDVLLQHGIEKKCSDFDTLYVNAYENATPYESVYKQTVTLRNVQYLSFLEQGLITGNNINIFNKTVEKNIDDDEDEDDDVGYEGALVAEPLFYAYICELLYGRPTNNIIKYSIDMDMASFYPNSIIEMNIDPSCLIFKVIIKRDTFNNKDGVVKRVCHRNDDSEYLDEDDVAKELFDNFQTGNILSTGHKWLNLPSASECFDYLQRKIGD